MKRGVSLAFRAGVNAAPVVWLSARAACRFRSGVGVGGAAVPFVWCLRGRALRDMRVVGTAVNPSMEAACAPSMAHTLPTTRISHSARLSRRRGRGAPQAIRTRSAAVAFRLRVAHLSRGASRAVPSGVPAGPLRRHSTTVIAAASEGARPDRKARRMEVGRCVRWASRGACAPWTAHTQPPWTDSRRSPRRPSDAAPDPPLPSNVGTQGFDEPGKGFSGSPTR